MRKWIVCVLIGACAAGMAAAEETGVPWYKKLFGKTADEKPAEIPAALAVPAAPAVMETPGPVRQRQNMQEREPAGERVRQHATPEQMERARAQQAEVMKLGAAARAETDPAKKEILVGQLRVKLNEIADRTQQMHQKRLEEAGRDLSTLKERAAESRKNREQRIEEQVQRILAGQPPGQLGAKRPEPPGERKPGKGQKKPVAE